MDNNELILAYVKELRVRKARTDFYTFYELAYPKFEKGWFQRVLCEEFQNFYDELKRKEQPRLMLFAPPRHGKSTTVHAFSAWVFGQDPDFEQIGASYGATLAQRNNKFVQKLMDSPIYQEIFPKVKIPKKGTGGRTNEVFEIVGKDGSYRASGVDGPISGFGCDIGLIDDPVRGMRDAASARVQETQRDWYSGDFYTRLSPVSGVLLFLTRWNVKDLAGWLLEQEKNGGDKWRILIFPAIAETDEYQYRFEGYNEYGTVPRDDCECIFLRKAGDPLHPERWNLDRLNIIKRAAEARGVWGALYQQRPTVEGGDIFKIKWFPRYDKFSDLYTPGAKDNEIVATAIHADTGMKTGEQHDFSVFEVWGIGRKDIYLLHVHRGKWEAPDLRREARLIWNMWKKQYNKLPTCRGMFIEDKASGTGLIQDLKRKDRIPVIAVQRSTDKLVRANDAAPWIESGNVWLPESASWLPTYEDEMSAFNKMFTHANDDQVDPTLDAIDKWLGRAKSVLDMMD